MTSIVDLPTKEYVLPGNRACAGCGIGIGLRAITKALEGRMVMTVPASCLTVFGGMFPIASVEVPWVNVAFPSTAAAAAGIRAGLRAMGREGEMTVLAMAGDGGTADPTETISVGGMTRSFILHVPPSYTGASPVPLRR
jgi:pyruvate ferredoxin oxidoreductase beta subunit